MNYNKLFNCILLAAMGLLLLASCKKDDETIVEEVVKYYSITFNAGQPSDDGSEITVGQTWKSGDKLAVVNVKSKQEVSSITYNGSAFTGESKGLYSGTHVAFFYPSDAITFNYSDTVTYTINLSGQDGTEATLKDYKSALSGSVKMEHDATTITTSMKTLQAIAHYTFTHQGNPINNIVRVEILANEGNLYGQRTYNMRKQEWDATQSNSQFIDNAKGLNGSMVINMLPTESVQISTIVETASGLRYVGVAENFTSIESGKIYNFNIECEQNDIKAHIGDYYYNDGSFSTTLDYGKTPVGIVFALTDKYGSDINNTLTESLHGRVVSLNDLSSSNYRWAFSAERQFDIAGLTTYSGASSTSESDSLAYLPYFKNGNENTYYSDKSRVSLAIDRSTGNIKTWPNTGALSSFSGSENTAVCDSSLVKFPAAYQTHALVRAGIGNKRWYIPAAGELALLYELWRQEVITAATKPQFTDFSEFGYWSSDEGSATHAWVINFFNGMIFKNYKVSSYNIRPCLWF